MNIPVSKTFGLIKRDLFTDLLLLMLLFAAPSRSLLHPTQQPSRTRRSTFCGQAATLVPSNDQTEKTEVERKSSIAMIEIFPIVVSMQQKQF